MPARIPTTEIVALDPETLEVDDNYPQTYGFYVRLARDPGLEWAAEFEVAYAEMYHPVKPPVRFRGNTLVVFYLPHYQDELPNFLAFLQKVVVVTNQAVEMRNRLLPADEPTREAFRERLRQVALTMQKY
jgi:hypothetical protein